MKSAKGEERRGRFVCALALIGNDTKEVIIATSFTPNGETTALYLEKILKKDNLTISRIGYGLPAGGDIEYVDELTLKRAIDARKISN